ncbi:hypothetical protein JCGZ_12873 [Jatropha curcas]|uniref:C2 domain-containing protein n=1 Tax=Jatropha curcas TaxID=180498 RepID=A0A067KNE1_JATCU|nr:uncharacterized protein LOC105638479 [Jatropha curcas]KDP33324.1 hypothetical protein JCGZ_12873 [Jatropha curcas]
MSRVIPQPFQLLELNVISGQDLAQVSRKMRTYAVAWVHPERKLSTRLDIYSHNNPTWNDKFVFRVDDEFLYRETSAIMVEIYAVSWFRDIHVGTVRVIVGNLIPPAEHKKHQKHGVQLGMRFVALQVRRRSGRPQGILNIGVAFLDASRKSMPLYTQTASAVGYRHMMGENKDSHANKDKNSNKDDKSSNGSQNQFLLPWMPKPQLRRTKSDISSMVGSNVIVSKTKGKSGSMVNGVQNDQRNNNNNYNMKESRTGKDGKSNNKPDSTGNGSGYGALTKAKYGSKISKNTNGKPGSNNDTSSSKFNGGAPSILTESELGPSPSEVVAAMIKNKLRIEEMESEIIGSWSLESSMEGLHSKLERWQIEASSVYDHSDISSLIRSSVVSGGSGPYMHHRRHSEGDGGVFSCFGSVCGVQCSIVCGRSSAKKRNRSGKRRNPSVDGLSFL